VKLRDLRNYVEAARRNGHGAELAIEARLTGTNVPMFDPKSPRRQPDVGRGGWRSGARKDWVGGRG